MLDPRNVYSTGSTGLGRSLAAFLLAPLLSCMIVMIGVMLYFLWITPAGGTPLALADMLSMIAVGVIIGTMTLGGFLTYFGMALIGVPTWLVLRFTNNESGLAYASAGAIGGWLIGPALGGHKMEGFRLDLAGAAGGAIALFLFWRMARRR